MYLSIHIVSDPFIVFPFVVNIDGGLPISHFHDYSIQCRSFLTSPNVARHTDMTEAPLVNLLGLGLISFSSSVTGSGM